MQNNLIDVCDIQEIGKYLENAKIPKNLKNYMQKLCDTVTTQQQQLKEIRKRVQNLPHKASKVVELTHHSQTATGNILVMLRQETEEIDRILGLDEEF